MEQFSFFGILLQILYNNIEKVSNNMMKLYNTLTKRKEELKSIKERRINLFVCGPTVYDYSHIGHARSYVFYDMLVRYLRNKGYEVFYLQNITDIDDKIIKRASEENRDWKEIASTFEREYFKDMETLGIQSVTKYARATNYISQIINQVKRLLEKGYAYVIKGGIYFDISKFKYYGKLSGRTARQAEDAVSRIDKDNEKRNSGDFCLWKFSGEGEPAWESPWGEGRPGWHIEDTAIAEKFFGTHYDIHGGARDLMFPHHEAEIAQMEALSGNSPMVNYWVHSGFLTVEGQKMSKSEGNFITIRDFLAKYSSSLLRFLVFSFHYRSPMDYSEARARQERNSLQRLEEFLRKVNKLRKEGAYEKKTGITKDMEKEINNALEDDFNTPRVRGIIFSLVSEINKKIDRCQLSPEEAEDIYRYFKEINTIFGIINFSRVENESKVPTDVWDLVMLREDMRKNKKWEEADRLREKIREKGFEVKDGSSGPEIHKVSRNNADR